MPVLHVRYLQHLPGLLPGLHGLSVGFPAGFAGFESLSAISMFAESILRGLHERVSHAVVLPVQFFSVLFCI